MADELGWMSGWEPPLASQGREFQHGFGFDNAALLRPYPLQVSKLVAYALMAPDQAAASKLSGYALMQPDKAAVSKASGYAVIYDRIAVTKLVGYALLWPPPGLNPFDGVILEAAIDKQRSITAQINERAARLLRLSRFDSGAVEAPVDRASSVAGYDASRTPISIPLAAFRGGVSRTESGVIFTVENNAPLPITAGEAGVLLINDFITITSWSLTSNVSGSIVMDIWRANGSIPSAANSITGSALPELASAQHASSSTLTGWETALVPGDVLVFNVVSNALCTRVTLSLQGYRT